MLSVNQPGLAGLPGNQPVPFMAGLRASLKPGGMTVAARVRACQIRACLRVYRYQLVGAAVRPRAYGFHGMAPQRQFSLNLRGEPIFYRQRP